MVHRRPDRRMCLIPGGAYILGSSHHYPEEGPPREVLLEPYEIDQLPVTNDAFAAFVADTGYVTVAEREPDLARYPDMESGSIVFRLPETGVAPGPHTWWHYVERASWRAPQGPRSDLRGLGHHPVVHIAFEDASAFAAWEGKSLPTEAQWEAAARGKRVGCEFAWGDELSPGGREMANFWAAGFPVTCRNGRPPQTTPVGRFPANAFGVRDMIGNAWEWTLDEYALPGDVAKSCCSTGGDGDDIVRRVLKGGSYLCAPEYCRRYRPAARIPQDQDSGTSHIGFRCVSKGLCQG